MGTKSPNSNNSRNLPYGLNHRRSLEDLVPSGNLKMFHNLSTYNQEKIKVVTGKSRERVDGKAIVEPTYYTCKIDLNVCVAYPSQGHTSDYNISNPGEKYSTQRLGLRVSEYS